MSSSKRTGSKAKPRASKAVKPRMPKKTSTSTGTVYTLQHLTNTYAVGGAFVHFGFEQYLTLGRRKAPPAQRLERSRERNRIHARRTRMRKKEQSSNLQSLADELREEQLRLKQIITEKNTANILVGLFAEGGGDRLDPKTSDNPLVEELLRRPVEDIPDASQMSELLPPLLLPGQHASKKEKDVAPVDGIDYDLLAKDRSTCSAEELDAIRRERNRMHAKRTRDRKRLYMGSMTEICRALEQENDLLRDHLRTIDPDHDECKQEPKRTASVALTTTTTKSSKKKIMLSSSFPDESTFTSASETSTPALSPNLQPLVPVLSSAGHFDLNAATAGSEPTSRPFSKSQGAMFTSLLQAAMLEEVSKKRACPAAVSSDDSHDDEAFTSFSIANKRSRVVEL